MLKCPICRSSRLYKKYQIEKYSYAYCPVCLTFALSPKPSHQKLKKYYQSDFTFSAGNVNELRTRLQSCNILDNLHTLFPSGKTLLDIGAGYGYFLDEAIKDGLKTYAIEPSKKLYITLKEKQIYEVMNCNFDEYMNKHNANRFDFITMIHLIEHVPYPAEYIDYALTLLNPNGILYIETPNLDSWLYKSEKARYTFLTPPDHIWVFSLNSFQYMLKNNKKTTIEKVVTYSYPEHFMGIAKRFLKRESSKKSIKSLPSGNINSDQSDHPSFKNMILDNLLAPTLTPLLNFGNKGSILGLYFRKLKE